MAVIMAANLYSRYVRPTWEKLRSGGRIKLGSKVRIAIGVKFDISEGGSISIGRRSRLLKGAILATHGGTISLGEYVSVNPYAILYGIGGLTIGNNVRIAAHTVIESAGIYVGSPARRVGTRGAVDQMGNAAP